MRYASQVQNNTSTSTIRSTRLGTVTSQRQTKKQKTVPKPNHPLNTTPQPTDSDAMLETSADDRTPLKPAKQDATPLYSTKALIAATKTPATPQQVRKMMSLNEPISKPVFDTEALQIMELAAFKVDASAYNSYLYTGKMKIPTQSNIAREDYASSIGAQEGKNIRIHRQPKPQLTFSLDDDEYDQLDEYNDIDQDKASDVENQDSSNVTKQMLNKNGKRAKPTPLPVTTRFLRSTAQNIIKARTDDDITDSDWDFSLDQTLDSDNDSHFTSSSTDGDNGDSEYDEKPTRGVNKRIPQPPNQPTTNNTASQRLTRRLTRNLHHQSSLTPSPRYNPQPPAQDQFSVVDIVVKYPLMGSLSDWKDSFQTCQEEAVMYRQIQTWKCPFLLRYYGTHGPGLVFEYVDGDSLDSLLFHSTDVDIEAQTWLWSELGFHITTALLYLHTLNISHNDIKPENVRYSSSKKVWKLLDLGLATDFDMKVSRQIGTNGYRSPEVGQTGRINRKSDVYSLGVMMDDALDKLLLRYQVLEDMWDDYHEAEVQYREEKGHKLALKSKGIGEIDLEKEGVEVLTAHIRRRRANSLPITVENSQIVLQQAKNYVLFLQTARDLIKDTLDQDYNNRPSVKRLLLIFRALVPFETKIREAFSLCRSMGIY